jgi:hypothetical protein
VAWVWLRSMVLLVLFIRGTPSVVYG